MFEEETVKKLPGRGRQTPGRESVTKINWDLYKLEDLLRFYDEIALRLPPMKLSELSVEHELLLQFHTVRALQTAVMDDEEIPVNQRAQVANTVAASVKGLADLQERVYTSERFKNIENILIRTLKLLPEAEASTFLAEYERVLKQNA